MDNNLGFTIIETMIALAIFAIALLTIAQMQITAIKANAFAHKMTTAVILAQDKLEELKGLPYNDSELADDGDKNDLSDFNNPDHYDDPGEGYTRVWNIADDTPVDDAKTVAVIVGWENWGHKVEIRTIIAR